MRKPVRKIRPSRGMHYRSKIPRSKSLKIVHTESLLERDFVRLSNYDRAVKNIFFQCVSLKYNYKGKSHKYYPDFLLQLHDGRFLLIEVKLKKYKDTDENKAKYKAGEAYCKKEGWTFIVVTEDEIRPGFLQPNLKLLLGVKVHKETPIITEYILSVISLYQEIKIKELMDACRLVTQSLFLINLYKLIYSGIIYTDLIGSRLTMDSILRIRNGQDVS
ncbi:TnsA endonuclease-like protein [Cohnella phaseoli]|uniref:TnsA endonuclease-like protein n=2 Tax=Cohnella phaseoli TaxID=456490 RepID=A0A3D9KRD4_9BACL|nr:TnsA endonuclease-like protein [Cohnella phaseoli]